MCARSGGVVQAAVNDLPQRVGKWKIILPASPVSRCKVTFTAQPEPEESRAETCVGKGEKNYTQVTSWLCFK